MRYPSLSILRRACSPDVNALNSVSQEPAPPPAPALASGSPLEEKFLLLWRALDGPPCRREYAFDPDRGWRFDFAWPDQRVAIEIEGGLYGGRHVRPQGYTEDCAKYNAAALLGWRVFRLTAPLLTWAALQPIAALLRHD